MADGNDKPWAGRTNVGFDALERVQRGLTVESIMTPRSGLMTCQREDSVYEVMSRNTDHYSCLPVLDEADVILGLYMAEKWFDKEAPAQPIGADFEPLSESLVIGADATIIEFLKTVDERPAKLVVAGFHVAGLVDLSDLQQLPVRAALFTLITSLEIAMAKRIEAKWPDGAESWLAFLSKGGRKKVSEKIDKSKHDDSFISEIVCTELKDKCTIIRKQQLIPGSQKLLKRDFSAICKLRNQLAHANDYAATSDRALKVCSVVKTIWKIHESLADTIDET